MILKAIRKLQRPYRSILRQSSGFTIVEVLVTVVVYALILGAGFLALSSGTSSWQVNNSKVELQQELRKAMDWMSADLRQAGSSSISDVSVSNTWSTQITFRIADGISGNTINWSTEQYRYYLGGTDSNQLKRIDLNTSTIKEISQNIKTLQVRRPVSAPNIVEVKLTGEKQTEQGRTINLDLTYWVTLRN